MSDWSEADHPRNGDGEFVHKSAGGWARKAAAQLTGRGPVSRAVPPARLKGLVRAGDHPSGYGRVGGADPRQDPISQSAHPDAGGVWYNPADPPGRRRYVNDTGWMPVSGFAPKHRTRTHREDRVSRAREDWAGTPEGEERAGARDGGKIGYAYDEVSPESLAALKRKRARARQDRAAMIEPRRRTPRGTVVSEWAERESARIARGRG